MYIHTNALHATMLAVKSIAVKDCLCETWLCELLVLRYSDAGVNCQRCETVRREPDHYDLSYRAVNQISTKCRMIDLLNLLFVNLVNDPGQGHCPLRFADVFASSVPMCVFWSRLVRH